MDGGVRGVDELSGDEAPGYLCRQLFGLRDRALHALCALGQNEFRAIGLQNIAALHAHGLRHGEDDTVAFGCRDGRKADAGVAGGGFDDDGAGLQQSLRFRVLDHRLCDPVLDAPGGIEVFQLYEDGSIQGEFLLKIDDLHERGVADDVQCSFIDITHDSISFLFMI